MSAKFSKTVFSNNIAFCLDLINILSAHSKNKKSILYEKFSEYAIFRIYKFRD